MACAISREMEREKMCRRMTSSFSSTHQTVAKFMRMLLVVSHRTFFCTVEEQLWCVSRDGGWRVRELPVNIIHCMEKSMRRKIF